MHFIVTCNDKKAGLEIRKANRDAHLAYLSENAACIKIAGPVLSDEGGMIGSLLICEADDKQSLEAVLATDPYVKADLFDSVTIQPWKWVVGAPT